MNDQYGNDGDKRIKWHLGHLSTASGENVSVWMLGVVVNQVKTTMKTENKGSTICVHHLGSKASSRPTRRRYENLFISVYNWSIHRLSQWVYFVYLPYV